MALARWLYGGFFVVVLPLLLWAWARAAANVVRLPAMHSMNAALVLGSAGLALMIAGMAALRLYGGGLPMNAFPPPRFVRRGIYRAVGHPIYAGFILVCLAAAIGTGSAAGLWLVTPLVALGCVALVLGYENPDLRRRFGSLSPPALRLPGSNATAPQASERVSTYVLVLLPWFLLYEAVRFLGVPPDAVSAFLPFEESWRVWPWTEVFYASTYVFVLLVPILARRSTDLRDFCIAGWVATALVTMLFLVLPLEDPPRSFLVETALGKLLAFERAKDTPAAAFPSFHVVWAVLAASLAARGRGRILQALFWLWCVLISASCVTTGMHSVVDIIAGALVAALLWRPCSTWNVIRKASQFVAGSWKEWQIGPVRIINHSVYAGAAAGAGVAIAGQLTGPEHVGAVFTVACAAMLGAGLWAQIIEGSSGLLRPFGYYGGIIGGLISLSLLAAAGHDGWLLLGAYAVAAPWVQAIGRLRCLVSGCCHGRATSPQAGIRYAHGSTRPCRIASLSGTPIYPTQTYSILWNVFTGPLLCRLWLLGASLGLIAGLYFILNGLGRFVEEAYRGEPQTPRLAGLPIYQWMALGSIVLGAVLTTFNVPAPPPAWNGASLAAGAVFGLLAAAALGVDFPRSNRRFARLA